MPINCRVCGKPENLAEPFVKGTCTGCLRQEAETKPAKKVTFVDVAGARRSRDGRWTGGQFIAVAALLFVASSVLAIVALAMAGIGLSAVADGNASFVALPVAAVVVGIVSTAAGVASVVMLLAGIIRLGVG
jgi:hypothetical protein